MKILKKIAKNFAYISLHELMIYWLIDELKILSDILDGCDKNRIS